MQEDVASYLPPWFIKYMKHPDFICNSCNCNSFRQTVNLLLQSFTLYSDLQPNDCLDNLKFISLGSPFLCRSCQKVHGILAEALFCDKFWLNSASHEFTAKVMQENKILRTLFVCVCITSFEMFSKQPQPGFTRRAFSITVFCI